MSIQSIDVESNVDAGFSEFIVVYVENTSDVGVEKEFDVTFFLSKDTIIDAFDYREEGSISYIDSNATRYDGFSWNFEGLEGDYYLIAYVDYLDSIAETNENNNLLYKKINVNGNPERINFRVDSLLVDVPDTLHMGQDIKYKFYIRNTSNINMWPPVYSSLYLSKDTILDVTDYKYYNGSIGDLDAGESYSSSSWVNLKPESYFEPGTYYLIYAVDSEDKYKESNEDDNYDYKKVVYSDNFDLELIEFLDVPAQSNAGSKIQVKTKVKNNGAKISDEVRMGLYISQDNVFDENDELIGTDKNGGASARTSYEELIGGEVPDIPAGNYYLIVKIDNNNTIKENNENNNTLISQPINILSSVQDLEISNLTLSQSTANAGDNISVSFTMSNIGSEYFPNFYYYVYISRDNILDKYDKKYSSPSAYAMEKGSNFNINHDLKIPDNLTQGNYSIIVRINDSWNPIAESNTGNNVASASLTVNNSSATSFHDIEITSINPLFDTLSGIRKYEIILKNNTDMATPSF
ncbi:MAG: CARDB domain-containing protein, partial [Bacteroidota bacterium]